MVIRGFLKEVANIASDKNGIARGKMQSSDTGVLSKRKRLSVSN